MVTLHGKEINYGAAVDLMDDEIRDNLHCKLAPCADQEFLDGYAAAHREKYGEEFTIN